MHIRNIALAPALLLVSALGAQIPNSGFEDWRTVQSFHLRDWQSEGNVSRTTAGSSFAARIAHATGALPSWLALADFNINAGPGAPGPAFAINTIPDSIRIRMNWNLSAGDTGRILSGFTEKGFLKDLTVYTFTGISTTYQSIAIPNGIFASAPCDSAFIWISSNLTGKTANGSGWIEVDQITLLRAGSAMASQLPNHLMSVWDSMQVAEPAWFSGTDRLYSVPGNAVDLVKLHPGAYIGKAALRLETGIWQHDGFTDTLAAFVNSVASPVSYTTDPFIPSFPVSFRPASFRGYSLLQSAGDTPVAELNLFYQGNLVGNAIWVGGTSHTDYRLFSTDIQYDPLFSGVPDSGTVSLYLGNGVGSSSRPGNYWVVDEIHLSTWATALQTVTPGNWEVYPNPVSDRIFIKGPYASQQVQIQVVDLSGRQLLQRQFQAFNGREPLDLTDIPAGIYTISIQTAGQQFQQRIIKTP
jgi:hypothetical protein